MGLFKQFIEVIEWQETRSDRMVYQFPVHKNEIKMGAQLTVREGQVAIFVNEGQIADVYEPGRYQLSTQNMPILTKLKSWSYGFNSPFKAEVYFVNTTQFLDQKWGTTNPIMMRDPEFGVIRLRGFGTFSYRVSDPITFMKEVFGTNRFADTEMITPQLKAQILASITDFLAEQRIPALDLATQYDEIAAATIEKMRTQFNAYGLTITGLVIQNLSLPEEVEKALDKRTQMGVIGDLNRYTQFQTAEAIRDAAQNTGGGMAGMGAAFGAASAMAAAMQQATNQPPTSQQAPNPGTSYPAQGTNKFCPECGTQNASNAKFCVNCGHKYGADQCSKCQTPITPGAKFCQNCGTPL